MSAILAFIGSIPSLVSLLGEIIAGVKSIISFIDANKTEAWFQHSAEAFKILRAAQTVEEKKDAAKKIRDLLGGL